LRLGQPSLIAADWGTTSFRAYLLDAEGAILDRLEAARGIQSVPAGAFENALADCVAPWRGPAGRPPIFLSGMIGSRQGWREAPYVSCPAGMGEIAAAVAEIETATLGTIGLAPGVLSADALGGPDVMRGEETQILGALVALKRQDGLFVLPGTHSKWARVEGGRIVAFATYMTGDIFGALRKHTILARLIEERQGDDGEGQGFKEGVRAASRLSKPGELLHAAFMTRTLGLFDKLKPDQLAEYLSGLLIGAEITAAAQPGLDRPIVIGSPALTRRYQHAGDILGLAFDPAPDDCVALGQRALFRQWRSARSAD
jgi:2-dehydro-3-deoxygalactonokinase